MRAALALLAAAAAASGAQAHEWQGRHDHGLDGHHGHGGYSFGPGSKWHMPGAGPPAFDGFHNSTFDQLIDHSNPELGTFSQFYYYSTQYWQGPGSPVILFTPGEINATGYYTYLNASRLTGVVAEQIGAATIVLEHRYWGVSSPFDDLTTENLQYLTLDNALQDMTYFAEHVKLPFVEHFGSNAKDVPWVTMGGSYSGAISAWLASLYPGTFWAYHASSAPVEAISDYWAYFLPIQQGMPQNCSRDVELVIDHMDDIFEHGTAQEMHDLKAMFMMETVEHGDDVMAALLGGPSSWQGNQFYRNTGFFTWCDYIEDSFNKTGADIAGPEGVGLDKALAGYATWWKETQLPGYCASTGYAEFQGDYNTACFDSYNASSPLYTDTSLSNVVDRQWDWMLCNEPFGYWQGGAPEDRPTIASRLVTVDYYVRQCGLWFPSGPNGETFGIAHGRTEAAVNQRTDGWFIDNTTRLIYANGEFDPWRECGVSSDLRPGGPLQSTAQVPVEIVPGGFHTSDLITQNGAVNPGVKTVQDRIVAQLVAWVGEWPRRRGPGGYHGHHWVA